MAVIRLQGEIPRVVDPAPIPGLNAVDDCRVRTEPEPDQIANHGSERDALAGVRTARDHEIRAGEIARRYVREPESLLGTTDDLDDSRIVSDSRRDDRRLWIS